MAKNKDNVKIAAAAVVGLVLGAVVTFLFEQSGGSNNPAVAKIDGKTYNADEVFQPISTRLFDLEEEIFRLKERAVTDFIEDKLLRAESEKKGIPIPELVDKEMGAEVAAVNDKEIEEFLSSKGLSLSDPRIKKDDVRDYLTFRKRHEKRQAYVAKLKETSNVKMLLKEPESPKLSVGTSGYPSWGNEGAPVTIVTFSDFECPYCSRVTPTITRLKKEYGPEKIRIVFRDMPLPSHPRAVPAAMASHCADEQGKFWEYHDMLFDNQRKLSDADLKTYAKNLKLDEKKFDDCVASKKHQSKIDASQSEAQQAGIQATPSFVINGTLLQGAQPFEKFKEKIDRALSKG